MFRRFTQRNVGSTAVRVGNYTVPANTATTVIGVTAANISSSPVDIEIFINETGNANTSIIRNAPVPVGSTIVVAGGSQKVVLQSGDSIFVRSTANNSVDVVLSILEVVQ